MPKQKAKSKPKTHMLQAAVGVVVHRRVSGRDFWLIRKLIFELEKQIRGTKSAAILAEARESIGRAQVAFEFDTANASVEARPK